ncbi:hypothetical protein R1sor_024776 [Riccia sorocarpa]|uniref:Uncharacterized protein n=1 Tax=Riccia sorocarpa TaxID=122646 RepID=A0ABD3GUN6_9MARC
MNQHSDSEVDWDYNNGLLKLTSISSTSSCSSTQQLCVSEESRDFSGGRIRVRRTVYQVEEEIAVMEVKTPEKHHKSAVQKVSKFGGRLLKSLFDSSPAEVLFHEQQIAKAKEKNPKREPKEAGFKSSSQKSSSSSGNDNEGAHEEQYNSSSYPAARKNHQRQDTYDTFITPGIRAYPKPRDSKEYSKYNLEKDSPGRSSRTTSTETSSYSGNNFESDVDFSTDSTGDRTTRREKERNQKALINRLHAEAMKMKLEKAEEEMQKLRMELEAYKSDSHSSVDGGDRRALSRINSLENSKGSQNGNRRDRPESIPAKPTYEPEQTEDDSDREIPPANWVEGQPDPVLDPPLVDDAWRSAQMYTFLQDAAAVNTVNAAVGILKQGKTEKKVAFDMQKSRVQSRIQSRAGSPTRGNQEKLSQQHLAAQLSQQLHQDSRQFRPAPHPHSRNSDSQNATGIHQQPPVHPFERARLVETLSSSSSSTSQERMMKRTQSVESNTSSKSGQSQSPRISMGGQSYTSSRSRSNTTIAERISRHQNLIQSHVQESSSSFSSQSEIHRSQQQLAAESNFQSEVAVAGYRQSESNFHLNFQAEVAVGGYRQSESNFQSNFQSTSQHVESDAHQQFNLVTQAVHVDEQHRRHSSYHGQTELPPQPEMFSYPQQLEFQTPRQPAASVPQPELFGRHPQQQKQLDFDVHRNQQLPQQMEFREQQHPSVVQQPKLAAPATPPLVSKQADHQRTKSMNFSLLPQLNLEVKAYREPEEASVTSPLSLSPTSSGLITPTRMAPPTVFQNDEERAAWQHQQTLERMQNARRNREALLLKQRGATAAR